MMFFKNLKIGAKLIALVVFLELIIVAVAWYGITMRTGAANSNEQAIVTEIVIVAILVVLSLVIGIYFSRDLSQRLNELGRGFVYRSTNQYRG